MHTPTHTKAAILVEQHKDLIVDEIELPRILDIGQVLVKISVSGICGSQLGEIDGKKGKDNFLPHLMGHEGCGEVISVGPGVKTVSVGDKVVLHWRKGTGTNTDHYVGSVCRYKTPRSSGTIACRNSLCAVKSNKRPDYVNWIAILENLEVYLPRYLT